MCLSHLPEVDLLTFEFPQFPLFGPFLVMAAKGEPLISGSFGQVREFWDPTVPNGKLKMTTSPSKCQAIPDFMDSWFRAFTKFLFGIWHLAVPCYV